MLSHPIQQLYDKGLLAEIDLRFAELMARLSGDGAAEELFLACVLLSNTVGRGKHVCLDFEEWSSRSVLRLLDEGHEAKSGPDQEFRTPSADDWMRRIAQSPVVGGPGDYAPLILDQAGRRLYLFRYWQYEQQLAAGLRRRAAGPPASVDAELLKDGLKRCFPMPDKPLETNWQKIAAFMALTKNLCVITGGPGTGKTFTAAGIIRLMLMQQPDMSIALCAPTGKAAARLQASMAAAEKRLQAETPVPLDLFPRTVYTIHRLLGASGMVAGFRYNDRRRLPFQVVIVDEASMVSLSLMAGLFSAMDPKTRLILLGDKNQLASVEAGAVLGDICAAMAVDTFSDDFCSRCRDICDESLSASACGATDPLADCAVALKRNYRFPEGTSINEVSRAINRGDAAQAFRVIEDDVSATVVREPLPDRKDVGKRLRQIAVPYFENICRAESVEAALTALDAFRIICAHRNGGYGVEALNTAVENELAARGIVDAAETFYKGRPVMITRNDYVRQLYNGDAGVIWEDESGARRACFPDAAGSWRSFSPFRLPPHETVFAMTIHKSQGSEFDSLLMILPEKPSPVLTRELVYTGLTRARTSVVIWADDEILETAVKSNINRRSGLRETLVNKTG